MKKGVVVILCLVFFGVAACDDIEKVCKEEKYSSAIVDAFPDSIQAGIAYPLNIQYIIENSCGSFVEFEETKTAATTEVRVKLLYDGCSCNLEFEEDSSTYNLQHDTAGTYYYKFYLGESDYDTYSLDVYN